MWVRGDEPSPLGTGNLTSPDAHRADSGWSTAPPGAARSTRGHPTRDVDTITSLDEAARDAVHEVATRRGLGHIWALPRSSHRPEGCGPCAHPSVSASSSSAARAWR